MLQAVYVEVTRPGAQAGHLPPLTQRGWGWGWEWGVGWDQHLCHHEESKSLSPSVTSVVSESPVLTMSRFGGSGGGVLKWRDAPSTWDVLP